MKRLGGILSFLQVLILESDFVHIVEESFIDKGKAKVMDKEKLIKELDSADLFLRNRSKAVPAPLTDYDIMLLQDAAKACDEAARALEKAVVLPYSLGDTLYYIDRRTGEIDTDTVKFITITKAGPKPILERHNRRFWEYYQFGVNVFCSREEAEKVVVTNDRN
jgi:hypothetical protein